VTFVKASASLCGQVRGVPWDNGDDPDVVESVMHGGTSGPAITPKDPTRAPSSPNKRWRPPRQFTAEEIELVRKWIADGAAEQ